MMGIGGQVPATRTALPEEEAGAEEEARQGVEGVAIVEAEAGAAARANESIACSHFVSSIMRDVRGNVPFRFWLPEIAAMQNRPFV